MLARIANADEKYVVAEQLLRRIIAMSPNEHIPHTDLGHFLVEQSRFPEAIEMFEAATTLDESNADNYRLLGDALAVVGRSADALAAYRHVLQLYPEDPHSLAGQGHMLRITGNSDDAIACYEKCTLVQPGFGDAWWGLASLKEYQLSMSRCRRSTAKSPQMISALILKSPCDLRWRGHPRLAGNTRLPGRTTAGAIH